MGFVIEDFGDLGERGRQLIAPKTQTCHVRGGEEGVRALVAADIVGPGRSPASGALKDGSVEREGDACARPVLPNGAVPG